MTLIRGRGRGLELMLAGREFDGALAELEARLTERPEFYRGTSAMAVVGAEPPTPDQLDALRALLSTHGIALEGVEQGRDASERPHGTEDLARRRARKPNVELKLSDSARSLVADFAGARADIAQRRRSGQPSVRRVTVPQPAPAAPTVPLHVAPQPPGTLYHVGTLRGGQALHHVGNIVVVGDVNPGTELVATGDVLVFGRLLGVAHAGAQGDDRARVYALQLQATQLRIATSIAMDEETREHSSEPEVAFVRDGRIVIAPFSKVGEVRAE